MPVTLPRYVAVTLTVTPTANWGEGLHCAHVSSIEQPDRRLPARARYDHRYAPLSRQPLRPRYTDRTRYTIRHATTPVYGALAPALGPRG